MATTPVATATPIPKSRIAPPRIAWSKSGPALAATVLSVAGVFSIFSTGLFLWALWTTDPLKSIGAFVPVISLLLILRAWRALEWETHGSWWGWLVVLVTMVAVHVRDHAVLELVLSPSWSIFLPPHSLVAFAYVSGAVLLFGGTRLYRAALFPILLMWLVNPVPHVFNRWIDLPLQHASAATARTFAQVLGQRLSPDQLRLMFTPEFGMFIAPGCDGIRGSVTMGFLALIAGYLYRFRLRVWALAVAAAVLLGYLFNLLRLCVLVLYYLLALRFPSLQSRAEMADYLIGGALFFGATLALFAAIRRLSPRGDLRPPPLQLRPATGWGREQTRAPGSSFWLRWAAFAGLVGAGSVSYARSLAHPAPARPDGAIFPAAVGRYQLRRTWQERLDGGVVLFDWGSYALPGATSAISVGVSPVLGAHDTLLCHVARGEEWLWHGTFVLPAAGGPVSFSASFFNDGATQSLEASTLCSGEHCGQYSREGTREQGKAGGTHFGLVYSRPDSRALLSQSPSRPIPVLLRVELPDATLDAAVAQARLTAQLRDFVSGASPVSFTRPYQQP